MERFPSNTTPERDPTEAEREMQLAQLIVREGIDRARRYEQEVDSGTAAVIATALTRFRKKASPKLEHFARYGHGRTDDLRQEYLDIYNEPDTPPEVKHWINWFGTHLLRRDDDAPWSSERYEELLTETKQHIFVNNHKAGLGLLCVLTDQAVHAAAITDDLDRLEADPDLDATDRIRLVWLRANLISYREEACDGACKIPE